MGYRVLRLTVFVWQRRAWCLKHLAGEPKA